ncbi:MAG: hypothetical protein FFODKBPE_00359 [Candidatus Argoarchaeum ethanivorans]|uniref:HTH arsR-type domain-containing protein n=1 Tax=Candidatus Argoarchaeum ethanivorans TaxID=2608793 RepID=A0A811TB99_9EURY|nr:MAG: hypothetical protein FFODKBPE_00359 [Candidatus Argoarchaeum ethanivorans]
MEVQPEDVRINPETRVSNLVNLSSLLFELSNPLRLEILFLTAEEKQKHGTISEKLKISLQETTRHLTRLQDAELIEKDVQSFFTLTNYGKVILSSLHNFGFLVKNREDLMNLNLDIPKKFLERIADLRNFEKTHGTMENLRERTLLFTGAEKYIWIMSPEILTDAIPIISKKHEEGLDFRIILPKNVRYPHGFEFKPGEHMKVIDEIKIAMTITEKSAGLCFPTCGKDIDFSISFNSQDEEFREWCKDLFLHYWENARPVNVPGGKKVNNL